MKTLDSKKNPMHYSIFFKNEKQVLKIEGNPNAALKYVQENKISWDIVKTYEFKTNKFIMDLTYAEYINN